MVIMMGIWCNDKLVIGWSVSTEQKQANKNKFCNYVKLLLQMDELTGPNFSFFLWENSAQAITHTFDTRTWAHEKLAHDDHYIYNFLTQIAWTVIRTFLSTIDFSHLFRLA